MRKAGIFFFFLFHLPFFSHQFSAGQVIPRLQYPLCILGTPHFTYYDPTLL